MVNNAETTAKNAEKKTTNDPGMCLQWSRERAAIGAYYGDAATAWRNTNNPHPGDRKPPRGAMAFWTGGSQGFGHIAPSVGGGNVEVRSTDSGGQGRVATVDVGWPERAWGMKYAGWSWDVNEVTIPHDDEEIDDMTKKELDASLAPLIEHLSEIRRMLGVSIGYPPAAGAPEHNLAQHNPYEAEHLFELRRMLGVAIGYPPADGAPEHNLAQQDE